MSGGFLSGTGSLTAFFYILLHLCLLLRNVVQKLAVDVRQPLTVTEHSTAAETASNFSGMMDSPQIPRRLTPATAPRTPKSFLKRGTGREIGCESRCHPHATTSNLLASPLVKVKGEIYK